MKYILSFLLTLSFSLFANSNKIEKPLDRFDFLLLTSKGEVVLYYDDDTVKARIPLVKGIRNGKAYSYYPDGSRKTQRNYINGKINGTSKYWYKAGKLKGEETIRDGVRHGYKKNYYKSGKIKEYIGYNNGELTVVKIYSKDGNVKFSKNYSGKN
jgi:antitoxin component YwqK of YwqJK toxin-antitoxin module